MSAILKQCIKINVTKYIPQNNNKIKKSILVIANVNKLLYTSIMKYIMNMINKIRFFYHKANSCLI